MTENTQPHVSSRLRSAPLNFKVVLRRPFPTPIFTDAPDNVLNPRDAIDGTDAVVRYDMASDDWITLIYNGRRYERKKGNDTGTVFFRVVAQDIVNSAGKTVLVRYQVTRGNDVYNSDVLSLKVLPLDRQ